MAGIWGDNVDEQPDWWRAGKIDPDYDYVHDKAINIDCEPEEVPGEEFDDVTYTPGIGTYFGGNGSHHGGNGVPFGGNGTHVPSNGTNPSGKIILPNHGPQWKTGLPQEAASGQQQSAPARRRPHQARSNRRQVHRNPHQPQNQRP